MNINYFSKTRILDGGMGQELLAKGLKAKGSLWSATALIDKRYHQLVVDAHLDFIKSGADVIVTSNFSARRIRMVQNKVEEHFNYANEKAGELALKAKEISKKNILIAGSLPAQNDTYVLDQRDKKIIEKGFYDQAKLIKPFVDFFYLDVLCGSKECEIALNVTEKLNLPVLVGLHIKKNGNLPSDETIAEVVEKCKNKNWLGLVSACVSPEIIENSIDEIKKLNIPFGYKANLWKTEEPVPVHKFASPTDEIGTNPAKFMGTRNDYTEKKFLEFSKKMKAKGATILGGCCETRPAHIQKISSLKN
ncbi:homocysteine S-methyltransferase family protein [Pelagibacteraceae bacterium]|nr:homocysteine S-methyltransferase family protein [Pelagibacteraceae bacterium]